VNPTAKRDAGRGRATLYDLATDCLRLSTHIFYPIQQCAQQVYYTALPLSPSESCLQSFVDNQLSPVTAFLGAPKEWGLLLRTIDVSPRRLVCIATSAQRIVAACEDIVNIYDAVTFVLRQSLRISETITKVQGSPDGSTLFFAHSHSVTMWDVQTGGLTHTFSTQSEINDIAVSTTGDLIACGSSDGSITFWNIDTKLEGEGFGNGQPVVAILWLSPRKLAVATQGVVYTHNIGDGETLGPFPIPGRVWGMVHSPFGRGEILVGTLRSGEGVGWNSSFLRITTSKQGRTSTPSMNTKLPSSRHSVRASPSTTGSVSRVPRQSTISSSSSRVTSVTQNANRVTLPPAGLRKVPTSSVTSFNVPTKTSTSDHRLSALSRSKGTKGRTSEALESKPLFTRQLARPGEELSSPMVAGKVVAWIALPRGVRSFDTESWDSIGDPPLLDAAASVAVSLNRNLVAQTEDSIQIFTLDVLKARKARSDTRSSHVYPLGDKHIVCLLQPNRHLTILGLKTLRELYPDGDTSSLGLLPVNELPSVRASFSSGLVGEFGVSMVMQAWRSGAPLPEWTEAADEDAPLSGLSPDCTRIVTFYGSPRWELRVKDVKDGTILANLPLGNGGLGLGMGTGKVYDVTFDSKTRFNLKIDGPGGYVQIPYDLVPSSESLSHTITKGEPVPLSEPRVTPPYTLDANCEWVVDAEYRKICWISPGNVRRGNGGHFWAGLSLVMVGGDGVVRKLSFKDPDR
jgi:WD40 repeat protein